MTAGLSVNSRYEPKNSRRSDTQIPSSLNSYSYDAGSLKLILPEEEAAKYVLG